MQHPLLADAFITFGVIGCAGGVLAAVEALLARFDRNYHNPGGDQ